MEKKNNDWKNQIKQIKQSVKELNLNKYRNSFIYNYEQDIQFDEEIYLLKMDDKLYIGNVQVPRQGGEDVAEFEDTRVPDRHLYWFLGNNATRVTLHVYDNVHNHNKCNQRVLNVAKQEIINAIKSNFNAQLLPDEYDEIKQFSKHITDWKRNIKKCINSYDIQQCREDLCDILNCIANDLTSWANTIVMNNRYTFISDDENDITTRDVIGFNEWTEQKKCLFIHMKDWLAMCIINTLNGASKSTVDFYRIKLRNKNFYNINMFNDIKTKFFEYYNVCRLILSLMYMSSSEYEITITCKKYKNWYINKYVPYMNKNIIKVTL